VLEKKGHHLLANMLLLVGKCNGHLAYATDGDGGLQKGHLKVVEAHDAQEIPGAKEPVEASGGFFLVQLERPLAKTLLVFGRHDTESGISVGKDAGQVVKILRN
jgi:hypothetical protein